MDYSDDLVGQRQRRIAAIKQLRELGINPYPAQAKKDKFNTEVINHFNEYEGKELNLAGRLMAKREHGKLIFGDIQDQSGRIQLAIKKDVIQGDLSQSFLNWEQLNLIDIGDFIQVTGEIGKTQQGQVTIFVKHLKLLSKSIRPLPNTFEDKEQRFRRRYLDFTINNEHKRLFERKAKFWEVSRDFMKKQGFIELETPILELVTGGADAKPFMTHHNALDQDFYLRISAELYLKRLIGAGFEKIFNLGPNFRNEGIDDEHLQEYYQLEWYWAYADYRDNMKLTRDLFIHVAKEVYGKTQFSTRGHTFDLANEWKEINYSEEIKNKFDIDIFTTPTEEMLQVVNNHGIELSGAINRVRIIDNLWKIIRKTIAGPAFLVQQPMFVSPLAKSLPDNPELTERFQIIIAGSELGNGYSEINDPQDQLNRFLDQQKLRDSGDEEAQMLDIDYVEMLEYGMPPTSGYGHSERVFWFFEDVTAREGTLFPQMKQEIENITKEIYGDLIKVQKVTATKVANNTPVGSSAPSAPLNVTRDEAHKLLEEHVKEPYQILHAKMVAKGMEEYAKKNNANPDLWYITGLLHDLDYYEFPAEHPKIELGWFKDWNYPTDLIHSISAHAFASKRTDTPPKTKFDFALVAIDELAGLLYAYSLMRPTGFAGMEAKSAMKKFKDKTFAAKIDRSEIQMGVDGLGIDLKEHISNLISVFNTMEELKK